MSKVSIEKQMANETIEKVRKKIALKPPKDFKVILHNDDYTPMEFVVWILETLFHKPTPEAERIMLEVHQIGRGIAGIYTSEIAEQKVYEAKELAQTHEFPLQVTAEVM